MKPHTTHDKKTELSDLLAMKLNIGDVVQLQDFSHEKHRHYVKLIGLMNKKSVLVSHPMRDEKVLFVKKGESFLVRGFSGTKTYDFTADVLSVCLAPFPYLHLSFPTQINTVNMRSAMRIKVRIACSIKHKNSAQTSTGIIDDLSVSGVHVISKNPIGVTGDEIEVSFRLSLDDGEQLLHVPATLRNVAQDSEGANGEYKISTGLQFHLTEGNERNSLHYFIYKNLAEK